MAPAVRAACRHDSQWPVEVNHSSRYSCGASHPLNPSYGEQWSKSDSTRMASLWSGKAFMYYRSSTACISLYDGDPAASYHFWLADAEPTGQLPCRHRDGRIFVRSPRWLVPGEWTITRLLTVVVIFLATGSAVWAIIAARSGTSVSCEGSDQRCIMPSHLLAALAATLLGLVVGNYVVIDVIDLPHHDLQLLDWLALASTCAAIVIHLWDPTARFPLWGLYAVGFMLDGMLLVHRDLSPGRFFVWTGVCELTGFLLVAALLGWSWQRFPVVAAVLKIPGGANRWRRSGSVGHRPFWRPWLCC